MGAGFWVFNVQIQSDRGTNSWKLCAILKVKYLLDVYVGLWSLLCVTTGCWTFKRTKLRLILLTFSNNERFYVYA